MAQRDRAIGETNKFANDRRRRRHRPAPAAMRAARGSCAVAVASLNDIDRESDLIFDNNAARPGPAPSETPSRVVISLRISRLRGPPSLLD